MGKVKDLTGQQFGRLRVLKLNGKNKWGNYLWLCQCSCGNEKIVASGKLLSGNTQSCGCYQQECRGQSSLNDLTGQQFGRLKVINRKGSDKFNHAKWLCQCSCGNTVVVLGDNLIRGGHTKSCGCYKRDTAGVQAVTHGESKTRLYSTWAGMVQRCHHLRKDDHSYENYMGRGIEVCNEWRDHYEPFRDWAKANGYSDDLEIDRIDVDGNYEPSNCRWVEKHVNVANRRVLSSNTSGYTGVSYDTCNNVFTSKITSKLLSKHGEKVTLGYYKTKKEALEARNKFIRKHNLPHPIQEYVGE